jgi:hypothetical protein
VASHSPDVVGTSAAALRQAGGLFLFGPHKFITSSQVENSQALSTSPPLTHGDGRSSISELKRNQMLIDGVLHNQRHRHHHEVVGGQIENIGIGPVVIVRDDAVESQDSPPPHRKRVQPTPSYKHHHPEHPHYEYHKSLSNKDASSSNHQHFQSLNVLVGSNKLEKFEHLDEHEKNRRLGIMRVLEQRLFDDRPMRHISHSSYHKDIDQDSHEAEYDFKDENEQDESSLMEFPEFLWAVWNLASVCTRHTL